MGLDPEFRAKLGWLVGNLYSRAASRDAPEGQAEKKRLVEDHLREKISGLGPIWIDDVLLPAAKKEDINPHHYDAQTFVAKLEEHRPPPPIDQLVREVERQASIALGPRRPDIDSLDAAFSEAETRLSDIFRTAGTEEEDSSTPVDPREVSRILHELREAAERALVPSSERFSKFGNRLKNNGRLKALLRKS